jgi:23S rRNA (uridine2552-2'-O)-methyltransferase
MAAQTTGHASTDHTRTRALAEAAFSFAQNVLKEGGTFVTKVFAGGTHQELLIQLKQVFKSVKHYKPPASRKESPEVYVVCQGFQR